MTGWDPSSVRALYESMIRIANESPDIREALRRGLAHVCEATGWPLGHAMLVTRSGLEPSRIWFVEDGARFETFRRITEDVRLAFEEGEGPLRRTAATGRAAWLVDVTTEADYQRARLADDIGVRGGAIIPVLVGDETVAVLEFYAPEPIQPEQDLLDVMRHAGVQLGRVFERQRVREAERRTLEAERDYLSMAAHEFTSPLATAGAALALLRAPDELSDEETQELLAVAGRAFESLRIITRNFLVDARLHGGAIRAHMETVEVTEILHEALADVPSLADEASVVGGAGLTVEADPFLLRQSVVNLLTNAERHGSPPIILRAVQKDGRVKISVTDHGPGVPSEFAPRLFERFARARRGGAGVGLGLEIVASLVALQDGHVQYHPNEPTGATFVISLPAATG